MTTELTLIDFYGDDLACVLVDDTPYVSIRHVCEALDVDYSTQLRKLKGASWASVGLMPTVDATNALRDLAMLPARNLPMWMVTIRPSRVSPSIRAKLERYQLEAADVLARHFTPAVAPPAPRYSFADDPLTVQLLAMAEVRQAQLRLEAEEKAQWAAIDQTRRDIEEVKGQAQNAIDVATNNDGYLAIRGYAARHGLKLKYREDANLGRMATARCKKESRHYSKMHHPIFNEVNIYPVDLLEGMHDEFVQRSEAPKLKAIG
jgi:hypothetical protein